MDEFSIITNLPAESIMQPYANNQLEFMIYVAISLFLLLCIGAVRYTTKYPLFENVLFYLFSENYAYAIHFTSTKVYLLQVLIFCFAGLQYAFGFSVFFLKESIFVLALLIIAALLFRVFMYYSMKFLYNKEIDVYYYMINYSTLLLFFTLLLFVCSLISVVAFHDIYFLSFILVLCLFTLILFVRWLLISQRFGIMKSMYFFLYFCTFEIVPLLLVIQYVT